MRAWHYLRTLKVGDAVPAECYVLDYRDGTRPSWTVDHVQELGSGGRVLVLIDPDNRAGTVQMALTVITYPTGKTLRTQPHVRGGPPRGMLCDMDQQARHVARLRERSTR